MTTHSLFRPVVMLGAVLLMAACSKPPEAPTASVAAPAPPASPATAPVDPAQAMVLKAFIEKGGDQCAEVNAIQGEDLSSKITVTCKDGTQGEIKYSIDLESEQAQKIG